MAVPYTFGTATASIPLSNLDSNFATTITLGNTAIQLGNTVTTLNNMTLANVTVSSGSVTLTNIAVTTANVTTANIGTAVITGTSTLTGLTASTALALDASKNIVSVTNTGSGNNVLGTSPTIATPTISTITSAAGTALTLQSNNGNTAVTVDTSQNVGIGQTPTYKLDVLGSTARVYNDAATLLLQRPTNSRSGSISLTGASGGIQYYSGVNGAGEASSVAHQFYSDSPSTLSALMTILGGGNVGIGTSSPSFPLTVVTSSSALGIAINGRSSDNFGSMYFYANNGSTQYATITSSATEFRLSSVPAAAVQTFYTNGAERMRIDSSGNVGIGTSSPSYKLDITGSTARVYNDAATLLLQRPTNSRSGSISLTGTTGAIQYYAGTNGAGEASSVAHQFYSDSPSTLSSLMTILGGGNVGIGTTSPSVKFQVNHSSDVAAINASGGGVTLGMSNSSANDVLLRMTNNSSNFYDIRNISSSSNFSLDYNGTSRMTFRASDGVLFVPSVYATTNAAAANVYVGSDGSIVRSTSSLKYKKDVQDATHGLADVLKLRSVTYKGKSESNGDTVFGGFIAEEIDALGLTEFVQYADDGSPDALAYGNMVSLLAKAIQEQQALITSLTARIAALEST